MISPISQMTKLSPRKLDQFAQGYTARKWENQGVNPAGLEHSLHHNMHPPEKRLPHRVVQSGEQKHCPHRSPWARMGGPGSLG